MKTLYRISLFINLICMAFLLIKGSEMITKKWVGGQDEPLKSSPSVNQMNTTAEQMSDGDGFLINEQTVTEERPITKSVVNTDETTSCDTVCHILESDLTNGTEKEIICDIPASYIGKTRKQLLSVIELFNQSPPLEEQNKGFVDMELVAFSRAAITIRKVYETKLYYCCIVVEDDYLTVYDEKREKVVLYTDISLNDLPEDIKQQVIDGKYMKTEQQLYDFLESYSS